MRRGYVRWSARLAKPCGAVPASLTRSPPRHRQPPRARATTRTMRRPRASKLTVSRSANNARSRRRRRLRALFALRLTVSLLARGLRIVLVVALARGGCRCRGGLLVSDAGTAPHGFANLALQRTYPRRMLVQFRNQ